jgi:mannose-6-phosphate isomerase-like protein (cupin superfamily)
MSNYSKTSIQPGPRTELHDTLALTGAEVSINTIPAGGSVPFVHAHKENEEIYGILSGSGKMVIDGEDVALKAGDWLRVAPPAHRQMFAAPSEAIGFICIQTKAGSLENFTATDGFLC